MRLSTVLKGLAIVLLPGGVAIAIAWWAITRRNAKS
jgi:hypothetical protein